MLINDLAVFDPRGIDIFHPHLRIVGDDIRKGRPANAFSDPARALTLRCDMRADTRNMRPKARTIAMQHESRRERARPFSNNRTSSRLDVSL